MRQLPLICALTLGFTLLFFVGFTKEARAQSISFTGGFGLGSGLTTGKAGDESATKRSPTFLSVEVLGHFDQDTFIKYGLEMIAEVDSRVTFGLLPKVEIHNRLSTTMKLILYVGAHAKLAPDTLFGPEAGAMVAFYFNKMALYARVGAGVFFAGSDLPEESALTKIDFMIGVRTPLFTYGQ